MIWRHLAVMSQKYQRFDDDDTESHVNYDEFDDDDHDITVKYDDFDI